MKNIMFIKPAMEVDAVFDPIRTTSYLGMWYLASQLKQQGHSVRYLDEVVRHGGLDKRKLLKRVIQGDQITDTPIEMTYAEFEAQKMRDFNALTPKEFVEKYTAFKENGRIERTIARVGNELEETLAEIEKTQPDVVGIPLIASANYSPAVELGRMIKERFPTIKVIYGGQHISAETDIFLKENPWVDHLVVGDAISVIEDIVEGKREEKVVLGGFQEMKKFPLLDPSIIEENEYPVDPNYTYTTSGRKSVDYMFSKGCFRKCEFCVAGSQRGSRLTTQDYDMIDEQLRIFQEHGIQEIIVQDDAFIHQHESETGHLKTILALMKKRGLYWQNNGGIDFEKLNDETTDAFIDYNKEGEGRVTSLYVPFNPRQWNKGKSAAGTMTDKYHANFENLKRLRQEGGIYVFTSEIIGTPEHTVEVMEYDIELQEDMIRQGYLDAALTLSATLLPGTKWNKDNNDMIVNNRDYAGFSLFTTHHRTKNIPDPRIIEEFMVRRAKEMNEVQTTYQWGSAFPNADAEHEKKKELVPEQERPRNDFEMKLK